MKWLTGQKVLLEYTLLVLAIMAPMLAPGFILAMDLVFTPTLSFPQELTNTYPLEVVLWAVSLVLPGDVIEKLVLFLVLLLSGIGMHWLMMAIPLKNHAKEMQQWGAYFAGIFYMINPFVYSRFMTGQWMVLLGYALVPFFLRSLLILIQSPGWRHALVVAGWLWVIMAISIHHSGILLLLCLVAAGYIATQAKLPRRQILGWIAAGLAMAGAGTSYWVIPALSGSSIQSAVQQFDAMHFSAFATAGGSLFGAFSQVIRLQGFWAEPLGLYVLPNDIVPAWGLVVVLLWIVAAVGIKIARRSALLPSVIIGGSAILAIILAVSPVLRWLAELVPFAAGYREPHKFVGLLALAFAFFGGFGSMAIIQKVKTNTWTTAATVGLLFLPIVITPTMLWGFMSQLQPRAYPTGWFSMNDYMKKELSGKQVLFLPWHQYMSFHFSGRIIANPAEKFFTNPVVIGDNPEFKNISPTVPSPVKQRIAMILEEQRLDELPNMGIGYILLAKEYDYRRYEYINELPYITKLRETPHLLLYKIGGKRATKTQP